MANRKWFKYHLLAVPRLHLTLSIMPTQIQVMDHEKRVTDEEGQAFLREEDENSDVGLAQRPERAGGKCLKVLRLVAEVLMVAMIVLLLATQSGSSDAPMRSTPVPKFPRKIYTFKDNPRYLKGDMWFNETNTLKTLHNWIELSAKARGYISVPDHQDFDLPKPYTVGLGAGQEGPGFMMTVFHQLHCLSYLAQHYQQGYDGVELTKEVAHHTSHCFNYLRQGIMCSADTTLEGKTKEGPGEGSEHECVDYDALLEWANEHSALGWRGNMPDTSVL